MAEAVWSSRLEILFGLVCSNLLSVAEAAAQAGLTEELFKKEMSSYGKSLIAISHIKYQCTDMAICCGFYAGNQP